MLKVDLLQGRMVEVNLVVFFNKFEVFTSTTTLTMLTYLTYLQIFVLIWERLSVMYGKYQFSNVQLLISI